MRRFTKPLLLLLCALSLFSSCASRTGREGMEAGRHRDLPPLRPRVPGPGEARQVIHPGETISRHLGSEREGGRPAWQA